MTRLFRSMFLALTMASAAAALPACSKTQEITAENIADLGAMTEKHEAAEVVWAVSPDGEVKALVKGSDGKPIEKNVSGKLKVQGSAKDATPVTADLKLDEDAKLLTGAIPKLDNDVTLVSYDLSVEGKPVKGVLHLPRGGTKELVESARISAEAKIEGKKGPNGGIIQVVGKDTLEIVADKKTGKTRVYLLDKDLKAAPIGDRKLKVKLAVSGDSDETVELLPGPKGLYFEGKLDAKINPKKITVVVVDVDIDVTNVVLCGWHPGKVIIVGPSAPVVAVFVVVNWDIDINVNKPVIVVNGDDDDDDDHIVVVGGKGKGKGKGKWHYKKKGKGVHVKF